MTSRILELAREQAFTKHAHCALMPNTQGHVQGMNDKEWGFSTCPHLDCVLVRELTARSSSAEGPTKELAAMMRKHAEDIWHISSHQDCARTLADYANRVEALKVAAPSEALRAIAAEWQPIETAPEAIYVMLWTPHGMCVGTGTKDPARDRMDWWCRQDQEIVYPTHWMPLPGPPAAKIDALAEPR